MPLTPRFEISQDADYVRVKIAVPYVRVTGAEMICDGNDFSFYCHPYLLKLSFPCALDGDDEERCKAVYDPDQAHGTITANLPKRTPGEVFPDLDLTTLLLQRRKEKDFIGFGTSVTGAAPTPSIEVIGSSTNFETNLEQDFEPPADHDDIISSIPFVIPRAPRYGFCLKYSNMFKSFREELVEMTELSQPDEVNENSRRGLRIKAEELAFDPERYLGDFFGAEMDPLYLEAMAFEPFWALQWKERKNGDQDLSMSSSFSEAEQDMLKTLPNREYLLEPGSSAERCELLGLIDVLFAFCFEFRCAGSDLSVESPHNVTRLSTLLSWLNSYNCPDDDAMTVITNSARRSLIYPYIRHWKLVRKVLADVAKVLYLGKRCVLRCLLQCRSLMEHTDSHYMLNKIFLDDYCVWLQGLREEALHHLAKEFNSAKGRLETMEYSGKALVKLCLPELEVWATALMNEGRGDEELPPVPLKLYPEAARACRPKPNSTDITETTILPSAEMELKSNSVSLINSMVEILSAPTTASSTTPLTLPPQRPSPRPLIEEIST